MMGYLQLQPLRRYTMAMKDDLSDFLFHLAIKWNLTRIQYPNTCRQTFFRRQALNLQFTAKKEVRTIVKAMLEYPDKADWIFDQHFQILTQGLPPSPDCHPINNEVQSKFNAGYKQLEQQYN